MKIILIGFMGAGKTTIARMLAQKLSFENIDMDTLIIQKSGRTSDKEIFEKDGEIAFREMEIAVAKELQNKNNAIISTGGGVVMNKIIVDYLKQDGIVIYLKNTFETAKKRIGKNPPPLFQDETMAKKLYEVRLPLYHYYANVVIETDDKNPQDIVEEIIKSL